MSPVAASAGVGSASSPKWPCCKTFWGLVSRPSVQAQICPRAHVNLARDALIWSCGCCRVPSD